jgi:hypothetical protein
MAAQQGRPYGYHFILASPHGVDGKSPETADFIQMLGSVPYSLSLPVTE